MHSIITRGLFRVNEKDFEEKRHLLTKINYAVADAGSGDVHIVVRDSLDYPGDPISYVAKLFNQNMARASC